jgi:hypothetical protein
MKYRGETTTLWSRESLLRAAFPVAVAAAGFAVALLAYYPGSLSNDSITMYESVVGGYLTDSKPPLMRHLWGITDRWVCGAGGMLIVHLAAYWIGIVLIAAASFETAIARGAVVAGLGFLPPSFGLLATIWVDVGMMAFLLLGVGLSLHVGRGRASTMIASAAVAALAYGGLVRYNAIVALPPLLLLVCQRWLLFRRHRNSWRAAVPAAIALTLVVSGLGAVDLRLGKPHHFEVWPQILIWDLAAITVDSGEMRVPDYVFQSRRENPRRDVERAFKREGVSPFYWGENAVLDFGSSAETLRSLPGDWVAAIVDHPGSYLRHRAHTMAGLLGWWRMPPWGAYYLDPNTRGVADHCRSPGYRHNRWNAAIERGLHALLPTPVYRLWVYVAAALTVLMLAWRWRPPGVSAAALVAISGLLYLAPQAVIAPSVEFRYGLWTLVASAVSVVLMVAALVAGQRSASTGHD